MKKNAFRLFALLAMAMGLTFASCEKENSSDNNNPGTTGGGGNTTIVYNNLSTPVVYSSGENAFIPGEAVGAFNYSIEDGWAVLISIYEQGAGVVSAAGGDYDQVSLLQENTEIGPSSRFTENNSAELYSEYYTAWNGKTGYIGYRFKKNGETHYGWVKAKVQGYSVTIYGYAYEGTAGKAIKAGATK
ncbi:MAG: hypothetical protein MJZ51_03695 [Bacteroidales bacterium]|nr:hypothetical protein [Bacteroidales bacterium]